MTPNAPISLGSQRACKPTSSYVMSRGPMCPWPHLFSLPEDRSALATLGHFSFSETGQLPAMLFSQAFHTCALFCPEHTALCPKYLQGSLPCLLEISAQISPTRQAFSTCPMSNSKCYCTLTKVLPPLPVDLTFPLQHFTPSDLTVLVYLLLIPLPRGIWTV